MKKKKKKKKKLIIIIMPMHLIDLRGDVLQRFIPFYLYTLAFVVLNCLLVPL